MAKALRITNADLADKIAELSGLISSLHNRISVIETETKVAKWVLRMLGLTIGSVVTFILTHLKRST